MKIKNPTLKLVLIATTAVALTFALSSCGRKSWFSGPVDPASTVDGINATVGPDAGTSGTFANVYQVTLKTACIECHVPGGSSGSHLDFSDAASAYQTLLGSTVAGGSSVGICGGVRIVAPGNAQASYLAGVLFSDYNSNNFGGVSGCQPYTGHLQDQNLSGAEKASILAWIQNGAPNN